jgi:hypothetical protein
VFSRKRNEHETSASLPVKADPERDAPGQRIDIEGIVQITFGSVEEAKRDIKRLRISKKELAVERRAVDDELAALRANNQVLMA